MAQEYTQTIVYPVTWWPDGKSAASTQSFTDIVTATPGVSTHTVTPSGLVNGVEISETLAIPYTVSTGGGLANIVSFTQLFASTTTGGTQASSTASASASALSTSQDAATTAAASTTSKEVASNTIESSTSASTSAHTAPPTLASDSSSSMKDSRLSPEAAVGIAIGTFLAGALLAMVLACLWTSCRSRRTNSSGSTRKPSDASEAEKTLVTVSAIRKMRSKSNLTQPSTSLPAPISDSDIEHEFAKLGEVIKYHATTYYYASDSMIEPSSRLEPGSVEQLAALIGKGSPITAQKIAGLLSNPQTRVAAVRFLIAWTVLESIRPSCVVEKTLLPSGLVECLNAMAAAGADYGNSTHISTVTHWRQLTTSLLLPTYSNPDIAPSDPRHPSIRSLLNHLDAVLQPLASFSFSPNDARVRDLADVIKRGARFGFILLSQPTQWDFEWKGPRRRSGSLLVVWPVLVQTVDGEAKGRTQLKRIGEGPVTVPL